MPRSIDPRNYGPFYDKLGELMDRGEQEIKLTMTGRLAIYHRNNFYAYINAWKHKAKSIPTDKTIPDETRPHVLEAAIRREDVLRKYLVVIDPEPNPDLEKVELRFIVRGMDYRQAEPMEQLDALLERSTGLTLEDMKERLHPSGFQAATPQADSPVAHLFDGVEVAVDPTITDEIADTILHSDPPDPTDLTDLVTPSNQPTLREEAMKGAEKLRQTERPKESKKIT